jgi:heme oxygenase
MNNLKELTKEAHRSAERTSFMNRMLKKQITPEQYYVYLKNQLLMYTNLELYASAVGVFDDMANLARSKSLLDDILEMEADKNFNAPPLLSSSYEYVKYIQTIKDDKDRLFAHVYVRHMGDLSGGQIIKKLVPGPTNLYEFGDNVEELKNLVRSKLHDGLENEAKVCFSMVQKFLEELEEYFDDMESTDSAVTTDREDL